MASDGFAAVILAAGKGTRMRSTRHKVLHEVGGKTLLAHVVDTVSGLSPDRTVLVVGDRAEQIAEAFPGIPVARQSPQLGTGHAVMAALPALDGYDGDLLVLYGDVPFVPTDTIAAMLIARRQPSPEDAPGLVILGFMAENPTGYGRLITDDAGHLLKIVEENDANAQERAVRLCNSGLMLIDGAAARGWLGRLDNDNAAGEYYLTDLVAMARADGRAVAVVHAEESDLLGVNSRADLAVAEAAFQARARRAAMAAGVTLRDPASTHFSHDTELGEDVTVEPHVVFGPGVRVARGAVIRAFSHLEGATVGEDASIGPYARLRPGTDVGGTAKIGNFVEIKKAAIGDGAKISHLSYIGDAHVGRDANIGAGTITCNYDGYNKYVTDIGAGAFIGSNSALVAPVTIGAGAVVGAGSVITKNVEGDALALTRASQTSIGGYAARLRAGADGKRTAGNEPAE